MLLDIGLNSDTSKEENGTKEPIVIVVPSTSSTTIKPTPRKGRPTPSPSIEVDQDDDDELLLDLDLSLVDNSVFEENPLTAGTEPVSNSESSNLSDFFENQNILNDPGWPRINRGLCEAAVLDDSSSDSEPNDENIAQNEQVLATQLLTKKGLPRKRKLK